MEVAATMPLQLDTKMEVLESALLAEFIGYVKLTWSAHSRLDQRRRCLRQLVSKVSAVVDAAEELERQAGPGSGGLDMFTSLDAARTAAATEDDMDVDGDAATEDDNDMDVDGRQAPRARARHRQEEGSGRSCASAGLLPSPGAKRKRACDGGSGEVDTVQPQKRRLLSWIWSHQWRLPYGSGKVSSAAPRQPALPRSRRARTVALAMSKIRRRIGKPTTTRQRPQPNLGQHFSRITL